jgi:hypothetical protein
MNEEKKEGTAPDEESERSLWSLTLSVALVPLLLALILSEPLAAHRPLAYLARAGALPWVALVAGIVMAFTAAYVGTRLRYSVAYPSAAAALALVAVYTVSVFYSAEASTPNRYRIALRCTWWALPAALGLWVRTVLVVSDEALRDGPLMPEASPRLRALAARWRDRRMQSERQLLGRFEVILLYPLFALATIAPVLLPQRFFQVNDSMDRWGGFVYNPTGAAKTYGVLAIAVLVALGAFVIVVWNCRPPGITLSSEARLHLISAMTLIVLIASVCGLFSNHLWPRQLVVLAFALYFYAFAALLVHAAVSQERVRRYSTLQRRVFGGLGFLAFACVMAAAIAPHSVERAYLIGTTLGLAIPLSPLGIRALFGYTPPPQKDEQDLVQLVSVDEFEASELAYALQQATATGVQTAPFGRAAIDAMTSFVDGLRERQGAPPSARDSVEHGKSTSDLRRVLGKRIGDLQDVLPRIDQAPAFYGSQQERLEQVARLVFVTATTLSHDPRFSETDEVGPPSRMEMLRAYCVQNYLFDRVADQAFEIPDAAVQSRLRLIYKAWLKGNRTWQELAAPDLSLDELKDEVRADRAPLNEHEHRRKKKDRLLGLACWDVKERWLRNLGGL